MLTGHALLLSPYLEEGQATESHGLSGERTVSPKEQWCRTSKRIRKEVQEKEKNSRYPPYSQIQLLEISYLACKRQREKETERHRKHPVNSCGRWYEAFFLALVVGLYHCIRQVIYSSLPMIVPFT